MAELTLEILQKAYAQIPHPERYPIKFVETDDEMKLVMSSGPGGMFCIDHENQLQIAYVPIGTMRKVADLIMGRDAPVMKPDTIFGIPIFYPEYEVEAD